MAQQHRVSPPGWYVAPDGSPQWRWWDGRTWTAHVAPRVAAPMNQYAALAHQHVGRLPPVPQDLDARHGRGAVATVAFGLASAAMVAWQFVIGSAAGATDLAGEHAVFVLVIVGVALVRSVPAGWTALWRRWRILDTPTIDAAGARPGLCEIAGRAEPAPGHRPLVAPLSGQQVIGYRVSVARLEGSSKHRRWVTKWSDDQMAPMRHGFVVRSEGGGTILVRLREPEAALRPTAARVRTRGSTEVHEHGLALGDKLFCLGEVTMAGDGTLVLDDPDLVVAGVERSALRKLTSSIAGAVMAVVTAVVAGAYFAVGRRDAPEPGSLDRPDIDVTGPLPTALVALGVLAVIAAAFLCIRWWNRVVAVREQVEAAWGHIEADLQRRHDTIGGLITVVKEAAAHEGATLDLVVAARSRLHGSLHGGVPDDARVQSVGADIGTTSTAEQALIAAAERHPQLRTHVNFTQLFDELAAAENRIAAGRRFYNDAITLFDDRVDKLPGLLVRRWVLPRPRPTLLQFAPAALPVVGHPWAAPPPPPGVPQSMEAARAPLPSTSAP